jgi:hypothetical protein
LLIESIKSELMLSDDEIEAIILFKLYKRGNWGASHITFDNRQKDFKETDLKKHGKKNRNNRKRPYSSRMIIPKPTSYRLQDRTQP